jgi:hypothetical protein
LLLKADWHSPCGRLARGVTPPASPGRHRPKQLQSLIVICFCQELTQYSERARREADIDAICTMWRHRLVRPSIGLARHDQRA